jgi:hypothetical protein
VKIGKRKGHELSGEKVPRTTKRRGKFHTLERMVTPSQQGRHRLFRLDVEMLRQIVYMVIEEVQVMFGRI